MQFEINEQEFEEQFIARIKESLKYDELSDHLKNLIDEKMITPLFNGEEDILDINNDTITSMIVDQAMIEISPQMKLLSQVLEMAAGIEEG